MTPLAGLLHAALARLAPLDGVSVGDLLDPGAVRIDFAADATADQRAAAQAALPAAWLAAHREVRCGEVDARTEAVIGRGFTFDGRPFSLSLAAQMNANSLDQARGELPWPQPISTADGGRYPLASADHCHEFALAMLRAVAAARVAGQTIRQQVLAAPTVEAVYAVPDPR